MRRRGRCASHFQQRHLLPLALAAVALVMATMLCDATATAVGNDVDGACFLFPGATYGQGEMGNLKVADAAECCHACGSNDQCAAWTFHKRPADERYNCYLKNNVKSEQPPRPIGALAPIAL